MRAAIYVRQSEDKTGQGAAVARQLDECRALADAQGFEVVGVYSDNDVSASSGKVRPEWNRLLADFEAGAFDALVCWHTDRLYRRLRDLVDLVELAEVRALRVLAVRAGDIDLSTPAGRMLAGMLGSAARYEVEQKGIRQKEANRQRARAGISVWSRRPFGFDRDGHDVFVVEHEAELIRQAIVGVLEGKTLNSIAADMNAAGSTTTLGNPWHVNAVKRAILNPRVAGRIVYNGEDYGEAPWGPLVPPAEYDRAVALLTDPRRRTVNDNRLKYLLSGLIVCDVCDKKMFATTAPARGGDKYLVYRCLSCKRVRKLEYVDELVEGVTLARIQNEDVASLLGVKADVAEMQRDADELRHRRDGLASLLADGLLSPDAVRTEAVKLGGRIDALERSISRALGDSPLESLKAAPDVVGAWAELGVRQRRAIVDTLMEVRMLPAGKGVKFNPSQIKINWKA